MVTAKTLSLIFVIVISPLATPGPAMTGTKPHLLLSVIVGLWWGIAALANTQEIISWARLIRMNYRHFRKGKPCLSQEAHLF